MTHNIIAAYYDGTEWVLIDIEYLMDYLEQSLCDLSSVTKVIQRKSKRSSMLHGIFVNPNCIGSVILDNPHTLFLQGVRYNLEDRYTPLETIIENGYVHNHNAKAGI